MIMCGQSGTSAFMSCRPQGLMALHVPRWSEQEQHGWDIDLLAWSPQQQCQSWDWERCQLSKQKGSPTQQVQKWIASCQNGAGVIWNLVVRSVHR